MESHSKLKTAKTNMAKPRTYSSATNVLAIKEEDIKKKKVDHPKEKRKVIVGTPNSNPNFKGKRNVDYGIFL